MNGLGLAAPNRIRCARAAVARPYGGSSRPRGLVVDTKICVRCGVEFSRRQTHRLAWTRRRYCTAACYRQRESGPLAERFWRYVSKGNGCWEWTAALGGSGYGTFAVNRDRMMPAHRFSWTLHFGRIPDGLFVCHHCDNRPCVRPDHLFLGTAQANTWDMDRKGRRRVWHPSGENNPQVKLTEGQVRAIRERRIRGETAASLAIEFGVSSVLISRIALRKAWRHVV
jgi:hypothetical protein